MRLIFKYDAFQLYIMKIGILFSGGKDSSYAALIAKREGYDLRCLISIQSQNKDSFMFHTPSISQIGKQAEVMGIPLIIQKTKGKKDLELEDLEKAIKSAKNKYKIEGIVTGAVESVYQASRIQKICDKLDLECFNPLWLKNQIDLLQELVKNKFEIVITSVAAYPLDEKFVGRKIDFDFIVDMKKLYGKHKINPAGEGGEFESFVLFAPGLFKTKLKIVDKKISGEKNSWRMEVGVE